MARLNPNQLHFIFGTEKLKAKHREAKNIPWSVSQFVGTEALSEPYRFEILLEAWDRVEGNEIIPVMRNLDFDELVGDAATLAIREPDQEKAAQNPELNRNFAGIVVRAEMVDIQHERTNLRITMVSPIVQLGLIRRTRIFQEMTTMEIVQKVIADAGFGIPTDPSGVSGSYSKRDYCVQYRESDLDFISRLLEQEGISYYFKHPVNDGDQAVMMFADNNMAFDDLPVTPEIKINPAEAMIPYDTEEHIVNLRFGRQLVSGKSTLADYNYLGPRVDVDSHEDSKGNAALFQTDFFDTYDVGIRDRARSERFDPQLPYKLAKAREQEHRVDKLRGVGQSSCRRFVPAKRFKLRERQEGELTHVPDRYYNREYILTRVTHRGQRGEQQGYGNTFEVIPAETPFRPPRVTPLPRAYGNHTATVENPGEQDVYVDQYGRVQVRFHWEQDGYDDQPKGTETCWLRVSENWAGAGYGTQFIPRHDQEVLVSFLEGNPDRPIITGRVYNKTNATALKLDKKPGDLKDDSTHSVIRTRTVELKSGEPERFNELRFVDKKKEERVYLHAQNDYDVEVEEGNMTRTVMEGNVTLTTSKGNVTVDTTKGNVTITTGGNHTENVTGARTVSADGAHSLTSKTSINVSATGGGSASMDMSGGSTDMKANKSIDMKANSSITLTAPSVSISRVSPGGGVSSMSLDAGGCQIKSGGKPPGSMGSSWA